MANTELQNQLTALLETSPSYLSLDAMKKGEMKVKLLSLPDEQMQQAIEVFLEEQKKMAVVEKEISEASGVVKQQGHRLHTLMLKTQTEEEQQESSRSSEEILKQLPSAVRKKGCMAMVAVLVLPVGALLLTQFFGIHIF
jgi:hypothetical protein